MLCGICTHRDFVMAPDRWVRSWFHIKWRHPFLLGMKKMMSLFYGLPLFPQIRISNHVKLTWVSNTSFAMLMNKHMTRIQLEESCFSHGRLYVGCWRVECKTNFFVYDPQGKTKTTPYQGVFLGKVLYSWVWIKEFEVILPGSSDSIHINNFCVFAKR